MSEKKYIAIDLKSFYASIECIDRGLDPMTTNLVVADSRRTEKTICLAVSPSLKSFGIPGRPRLFEVVQRVKKVNAERKANSRGKVLGSTYDYNVLQNDERYAIDYIVAPPRMALYVKYSTEIYQVYLKYVSPDDIHVYSIDEVFIDATNYLKIYDMSAHDFAMTMIKDVLATTGVTATAGIGDNLYLCKIAMDIMAKRMTADEYGVRVAELTEMEYRKQLWDHQPITDFWRVGAGYKRRLEKLGLHTMGDIALCSVSNNPYYNEDLLYKEFGVNAELLIDHAWGWENCTIADIKSYKPISKSISIGQVLTCPYDFEKGLLIAKEMAERLSLDLTAKGLVTDQIVLTVGYDIENADYKGVKETDRYGRVIPKQAHGSRNIGRITASTTLIVECTEGLYREIVNPDLSVRRMYVVANHTIDADEGKKKSGCVQLDLFTDVEEMEKKEKYLEREERGQKAVVAIQEKYGKNAILKGMNLEEGATTRERNGQIGGHKA